MPDGPNPGQSYEAWIESMAGASPPEMDTCQSCGAPADEPYCGDCDWPQPVPPPYTPPDDEGLDEPSE